MLSFMPIMAKKSTDTNFNYTELDLSGFYSKPAKMFPGDKMSKMVLS